MSQLAVRREIERNASGVISLVVIPSVFGLLGAYSDKLKDAVGAIGLFLCWSTAILLLGFFAVRLHLPERSVLALLVDNEDLSDKHVALKGDIDELEAAINLLSLQVNFCESVRGVRLAHSRNNIKTCEDLGAAISDIVAPIYLQTEEFFGCGASEKWCFTVYLYSHNENRLLPVWRKAALNHPAIGPSRIWGMGQGHVGKAFVDQRSIITGNATAGEVSDFSAVPPGMDRSYDTGLYVSFASIPIGPILEEDGRPYGVLVGTSDRAGRFDRENTSILVQVAGAVASLLIAGKLDIDQVAKVDDNDLLEDLHGISTGTDNETVDQGNRNASVQEPGSGGEDGTVAEC